MQRYSIFFSNYDGEILDFSRDGITVMGRQGDWGTTPFEVQLDEGPDGVDAVALGVVSQRGTITLQLGIEPEESVDLMDLHRLMSKILRPRASRRVPNAGWLYYERQEWTDNVQLLRIPVVPVRWSGWNFSPGDSFMKRFTAEVSFTMLSDSWEYDPVTSQVIKAQGAATWSSVTTTITPGGDIESAPLWTVAGPSSGTLTSVTILNDTTGQKLQFTGLSLTSGQSLVIPTGHMQKVPLANGVSVYSKRSQDSEFWHLLPGGQQVTVTKNATSQSALTVEYRPRIQGL